jgi:hypothetical protein
MRRLFGRFGSLVVDYLDRRVRLACRAFRPRSGSRRGRIVPHCVELRGLFRGESIDCASHKITLKFPRRRET